MGAATFKLRDTKHYCGCGIWPAGETQASIFDRAGGRSRSPGRWCAGRDHASRRLVMLRCGARDRRKSVPGALQAVCRAAPSGPVCTSETPTSVELRPGFTRRRADTTGLKLGEVGAEGHGNTPKVPRLRRTVPAVWRLTHHAQRGDRPSVSTGRVRPLRRQPMVWHRHGHRRTSLSPWWRAAMSVSPQPLWKPLIRFLILVLARQPGLPEIRAALLRQRLGLFAPPLGDFRVMP